MYSEIEEWRKNGCDWTKGVQIYLEHGKNSLMLKLCNGSESSFAKSKLISEMKLLETSSNNTIESKSHSIPIIEKEKPKVKVWNKKSGVQDYHALPDKLKKKRDRVGVMFKEVIEWRKEIHELIGTSDKKMITLENAMKIMDHRDENGDAAPFTLTYVTYNSETKKGGEVVKALCKFRVRQKGLQRFASGTKKTEKAKKNPNHSKHGTINIQWVNTLEFATVHTFLIFEINERPVSVSTYG